MTDPGLQWVPFPGLLADLILVVHVAVVGFVVAGQGLFMLGGCRDWAWVRRPWPRITHLLLILFVVGQAWLGRYCPLTLWEFRLRLAAGESAEEQGFIEYWLGEWLFFDFPGWVFVVGYTAFAALVLFTWWWVPPRRR